MSHTIISEEKKPIRNRVIADGGVLAFSFLGLVLVLFIAIPVAKLALGSEPDILLKTLLDPVVQKAIWLTFSSALAATLAGCIFGVPLAYLLARYNFPGKPLVEGLIDLPVVIPHTAAGIALLFVFGRNYLIGSIFERIGIVFIDSQAGIVVAMLFVSVPYLINSARNGFEKVDVRLEKVARSLGASWWQTFSCISLPLASRNILSGNIMMWARGVSEFGAVVILTYHPMIAPVLVYERFETLGLKYSQPVAAILVIVSIVIFIALRAVATRGEKS